jgi:hypothetical protein
LGALCLAALLGGEALFQRFDALSQGHIPQCMISN